MLISARSSFTVLFFVAFSSACSFSLLFGLHLHLNLLHLLFLFFLFSNSVSFSLSLSAPLFSSLPHFPFYSLFPFCLSPCLLPPFLFLFQLLYLLCLLFVHFLFPFLSHFFPFRPPSPSISSSFSARFTPCPPLSPHFPSWHVIVRWSVGLVSITGKTSSLVAFTTEDKVVKQMDDISGNGSSDIREIQIDVQGAHDINTKTHKKSHSVDHFKIPSDVELQEIPRSNSISTSSPNKRSTSEINLAIERENSTARTSFSNKDESLDHRFQKRGNLVRKAHVPVDR